MKQLLNDKKLLSLLIVCLVVVIGGVYFILSNHKNTSQSQQIPTQIEAIPTLSPSDIGLKIVPHIGNKCSTTPTPYNEVKFQLNKTADVKHVSWQFTYDADIPPSEQIGDGTTGQVTQQLGSDEGQDVKSNQTYDSRYEFLGTCSKNVCRCDTGVKAISLVLKLTKSDNKVYEVKDSVNLLTYNP